MAPTRPAPLKLRRNASGRIRAVNAPDRAPLVVRAGTALAQLTRRTLLPDARPVDVQVVIQVAEAAAYAPWRAAHEQTWVAEGGRWTTASWPAALPPEGLGAVLLPLPYLAAPGQGAKTPPVVADPLFSTGSRADGAAPEDVAIGLLAEWLRQAATGPALRLAPPVLETAAERRTLDLGLTWPLAPRT